MGDYAAMSVASLQRNIRTLYEGEKPEGFRFRYALLAFDIVTVLFIIATSFLPSNDITEALDVLFGLVILADFSARLLVSRHRLRDFTRFSTWTDVVAIISFLAPLAGLLLAMMLHGTWRVRPAAFFASCEHCGCCATTRCWCGCARTSRSFGATRKLSLPSPISQHSSS